MNIMYHIKYKQALSGWELHYQRLPIAISGPNLASFLAGERGVAKSNVFLASFSELQFSLRFYREGKQRIWTRLFPGAEVPGFLLGGFQLLGLSRKYCDDKYNP